MRTKMDMDINKVAQGFWQMGTDRLRELRKYVEYRKEQMPIDYCLVYTDILIKIDEMLKKE